MPRVSLHSKEKIKEGYEVANIGYLTFFPLINKHNAH
nr:MAG TPA: hypothetical protein [Caudoviricetes sp.]